jgi:type VI secretion system protein VasG
LHLGGHRTATVDLKRLAGRLNETCRRVIEVAAGLTLSRTHYNVGIEHWLVTLADRTGSDVAVILRHYETGQSRCAVDLNRALVRMKAGNGRAPSLAPDIVEPANRAWPIASLEQSAARIRSGVGPWRCWPTRRWRGVRARRPGNC